ncbi:MAG: hypothetical protein IJO21_07125 [Oscillospiraceae bacterium]|nr:hypothetical protein [Oscillospiraceae bacterium]MBQ7130792.1 hypothetical protein [Oscillospiraceae bacterium]
MFGYVSANVSELTKEQRSRYNAIYCGICRRIRMQSGNLSRVGLSYDMAFLAALLMSLYEPEEDTGSRACMLHPVKPRAWVDNRFVQYAADMNVALAYYNFLDDWEDDGKHTAKMMADLFSKHLPQIEARYPRQCAAIQSCIRRLSELERENCANPDAPAACFGELMAELFTYEEDLWAPTLRRMGESLGRFIYLLDAALDYDRDAKKEKYNPYLAMGTGKDWDRWEEYLILTMGRCTANFEKLPLVQDKPLLDNILYSGVWTNYRRKRKEEDQNDRRSL